MSEANVSHPQSSCSPVTIEKMVGGGTSWYYALQDGKVLGAAHEDNVKALQRLRDIQKANTELSGGEAVRSDGLLASGG
jgi:hypothetical protein